MAQKRSKFERALVGPAGEHFVLYQLHRQGLMASLAPRNAPTVDVLVFDPNETIIASLQVKTRTYGVDKGWHLKKKHERIVQPHLFYALVDLEPDVPVTYVVPSKIIANVIAKAHRAWLKTPGRGGRQHKDHDMRRVLPRHRYKVPGYPDGWLSEYAGRWDLLRGKS